MPPLAPIRFCHGADGTRLAYSVTGDGPPLLILRAQNSDDELDAPGPGSRHWLDYLSQHHSCIRFDARGCGLSQRGVGGITRQAWAEDIDAVTDAAGQRDFALFAFSNAAVAAIDYAAAKPHRVTRLVVYGGYARGRLRREMDASRQHELHLALDMIATGHGSANDYSALIREMFYKQHYPNESV